MIAKYLTPINSTDEVREALRKWAKAFFVKEESFNGRGYDISMRMAYEKVGMDTKNEALALLISLADQWSNDLFDLLDRCYNLEDGTPAYEEFYGKLKAEAKEIYEKGLTNPFHHGIINTSRERKR